MLGVHELGNVVLGVLLAAGGRLELPEQATRVQVGTVPRVRAGGKGELSLTLLETPAPGFSLEVRIDDSPLSLLDQRLGWSDVVDPLAHQPRLSAPFVAPQNSGRYRIGALVSYVTCDDRRCRTRRARVSWEVEVFAPEPLQAAAP